METLTDYKLSELLEMAKKREEFLKYDRERSKRYYYRNLEKCRKRCRDATKRKKQAAASVAVSVDDSNNVLESMSVEGSGSS